MQARWSRAVKRPLKWAIVRRFIRQQDGATAVEFAMVAAPFLAMMFAIIETALVFFAGQALETAGVCQHRTRSTTTPPENRAGGRPSCPLRSPAG